MLITLYRPKTNADNKFQPNPTKYRSKQEAQLLVGIHKQDFI